MLPVSKISEIEVLDAELQFEAMFFAPLFVTIGQEIRGGEQFRNPKTASKVSTHTKLYIYHISIYRSFSLHRPNQFSFSFYV